MKKMGSYRGLICYECSQDEYLEEYEKGRDNGDRIYVIDGRKLIKKGYAYADYTGRSVEVYDTVEDYIGGLKKREPKKEQKNKPDYKPAIESEDYSAYSQVVDDFFKDVNNFNHNV